MTTDEEKISRLYKQGKEAGPPAHLDSTILSAARDAVQQNVPPAKKQATASGPFSGGWRVPASIAAILVITVILVPLLQQEEMSPTVSRVADDAPMLKKEQDLIRASDIKAPDARKPGATKENREANIDTNITAKKRPKTAVLEQRQERQLYQAPANTVNMNTFSRGKQFVGEEKIAPVRTMSEMAEGSLPAAQKPQPASSAVGAAALYDQEPHEQGLHNQEQGASAEIKQQSRRMLTTDKMPSVFMAAKPWLQKIRQLITQGDLALAQQELDKFKLHYPDEEIDLSIINQLKGVTAD